MDIITLFSTPEAWVQLITLIFLEMVLGIDNLVFIAITSDRVAEHRKHLCRRLGLIGALCMRIALLSVMSWLASLTATLFTIPGVPGAMGQITARDIIMLVGGIYLLYKGIAELVAKVTLKDEKAQITGDASTVKHMALGSAVALIMAMDVIFSLDSVITAVGMVNELPIMVAAVIAAVLVMIIFADPISDFINQHSGVKILALAFIAMIGVLLTCEGLDIHLDKAAIYYAMGFSLIVQVVEIKWRLKGALIAMAVFTVASIAATFVFPGMIRLDMGLLGLVASAIIISLLHVYQRNYTRIAKGVVYEGLAGRSEGAGASAEPAADAAQSADGEEDAEKEAAAAASDGSGAEGGAAQ